MTAVRPLTASRSLDNGKKQGLSRLFGDIAGAFEAAVEIVGEAFDLTAEARERFPAAD
jgi:hypothetical protein